MKIIPGLLRLIYSWWTLRVIKLMWFISPLSDEPWKTCQLQFKNVPLVCLFVQCFRVRKNKVGTSPALKEKGKLIKLSHSDFAIITNYFSEVRMKGEGKLLWIFPEKNPTNAKDQHYHSSWWKWTTPKLIYRGTRHPLTNRSPKAGPPPPLSWRFDRKQVSFCETKCAEGGSSSRVRGVMGELLC